MGFVDAVKEFVGFGDIDYEDEMDELEVVEEVTRENRGIHSLKKNKVVPINPQNVLNQIVVMKPKSFSESKNIADELKRRHPVIIDVGGLDADEARRVVDFVAGTVHGVDGNMQKVSGGIFLATPNQMDIMGEVPKDHGSSFEWSMI